MKTRTPTFAALSLLAVFLLRALIPAGYMPSSLANGLPFVLCPDNLPAAFAAQFEDDTHHDHAGHHGDPGTAAIDHCDFGQMVSSIAPPLDDQSVASAMLAAPYHAITSRFIVGQTRQVHRARGPPWQEQT